MSHDYQTATFLIDAAISEDLKHNPSNPTTPALLFMDLNEKNKDQTALPIVKSVVAKLKIVISDYNGRAGNRSLTLAEQRKHFFNHVLVSRKPHLRTLTTALLSYVLAWSHGVTLIDLSENGSREPFLCICLRAVFSLRACSRRIRRGGRPKKHLGPYYRLNCLRTLTSRLE
jgi:hypothetical protein